MKTFTLFLFLLLTSQLLANELSWVDEQVKAIKPPRKGISTKEITSLKDPFVYYNVKKQKNKKTKVSSKTSYRKSNYKKRVHTARLTLEAIINKSALINGKWYKEGSKVFSYRLKKVNAKSVLLTKGKKEITLTTMSTNKNLKFKNN